MNKMFKKFMAVTATAAIAASMSISAFAANVTVAPTDSSVSVSPESVTGATMYTVMVFQTSADITDVNAVATATPTNSNSIYYINQGTDVTALVTNMLVKATTVDKTTSYLPVGNYVVRIGNDKGTVQNFTLESKEKTITILYGDVNGDGEITPVDKTILARHLAGWEAYTADKINYAAADVNDDGSVTPVDKTVLARHLAGWEAYATLPFK